ncbi:MAG: gamma-glutamyl-gamma-aminobutyrate hydrolase family protein [Clostridia bacterium]|nr:gamma-glutamyl-gamma-aminobutyrate hydrolase family protein [Clostridia bacterium]
MINGKPLICITADSNSRAAAPNAPRDLWLNDFYCEAIHNAGGVAVITGERNPEEYAELCDGVIMSGGPDLEPEYYGETVLNDTVRIDPPRTAFELPLMQAFIERKKPMFGICRGFQMINYALGGTLYQDLVEQLGYVHFAEGLYHDVTCTKDSVLCRLFGEKFKVNSYHHQAVKDPGRGLIVTARSVEGIIEAYEHESLPIIGTQFHPERMSGRWSGDKTPDFAPIFDHFINMTKK